MTDNRTKPPPATEENATVPAQASRYPALEIDYALYESYLESSEWNDDQKREFLETLWNIIVQFVDLGFEIHPLQQACGQNGEDTPVELAFDPVDMIAFDQENSAENTTNNAARPFSAAAERKET